MKSFFDMLEDYGSGGVYPYHMPGHKRRLMGLMPEAIVKADITEIEGFDNLHDASGVLLELEEQASKLYGSDESFYLVGGSTCGILSAVSSCVPKGGQILMARNCHKSAYHAAYLRDLQVHYLESDIVEGFGIPDRIRVSQVRDALDRYPEVAAVLLVSPTYEGRISEISQIAALVHERGRILIVDEAHGAHLGLADGFSDNSVTQGADVVIHSVHKTLPAMTQTALLHVKGERVDRAKMRRFLQIYQSSSPSYILMASIDNAIRAVNEQGQELFASFHSRYDKMISRLEECKLLQFLPPRRNIQDIGKLVISTAKAGITGKELSTLLLEHYQLQLEMACGNYALAMFTIGDDEEGYNRLTEALLELDGDLAQGKNGLMEEAFIAKAFTVGYGGGKQKVVYPISQAWDMEGSWVDLDCAVGRVAGEFITLYPPGTPMLVPGEEITEGNVSLIRQYLDKGFDLQGIKQVKSKPHVCCIVE